MKPFRRYGLFEPDPDMRALLRALLDVAEPTAGALELVTRGLTPDANIGLQRLIPLALSKPWAARLPPDLRERCDLERRGAAIRSFAYNNFVVSIVRMLNQHGITPLLLKGYPLGRLYYAEAALRPSYDLDFLLKPEDRSPALKCLQDKGFEATHPEVLALNGAAMPSLNHGANGLEMRRAGASFDIDLHWYVLQCSMWEDADAGFWRRAVAMKVGDGHAVTLGASDHLLHACMHGRQQNGVLPFRWIVDAGLILTRSGSVDWDTVVATAREHRFPRPVGGCLVYLRDVIGLPVPREVTDELSRAPMPVADRMYFAMDVADLTEWSLPRKLVMKYLSYRRLAGTAGFESPGFFTWWKSSWNARTFGELVIGIYTRITAPIRRRER
jgi:hypothetical protein